MTDGGRERNALWGLLNRQPAICLVPAADEPVCLSKFTYIIKLVDVIGQEVDDLARGGLSHGVVIETQSLE